MSTVTSGDLVTALEALAEVLQTQQTLGGALAGIADDAAASVPGCDAATIAWPSDPGQRMLVYSAEPGFPSHEALQLPPSWAGGTDLALVERLRVGR